MAAILYYLLLPFIYLLSILPFRVIYLLSDVVYILLYKVLGYRKQVVLTNLRNAFPDKSEQEIETISKAYYKNLCDLITETSKMLTISGKQMLKHCYFNPETTQLFTDLAARNKSCIIVMGHIGNWEWGGITFSLSAPQKLYGIYHPLKNKYFDKLIYKMRTRFGGIPIPMNEAFKRMLAYKGELSATTFVSDQTPPPENAYWTTFLNQDTPVFKGTEIISRKLNYAVVYLVIKKVTRGYYEMFAELLIEDPKSTTDGEISELHTRRLEQDIIANPEAWLWSHRRWKHKRPA